MGGLWQDVRYAARMLGRQPAFAAIAVLTLAVGIGANTAIFSLVNTVLLKPLPYEDPEGLVGVWDIQPEFPRAPASYPSYLAWKDQKEVFEDLAAFFDTGFALTGQGDPESLEGVRISSDLLRMLGLRPEAGRSFLPEEDPPNAERVAMLGYAFWQRRFAGRTDVIGGTITLDDQVHTVVGILPRDLRLGGRPDVAIPLRLDTSLAPPGLHFLDVVGRLKPGVSVAQARARLAAVSSRLREDDVDSHEIGLQGLQERIVESVRPSLLLFLGAVGFVLLIACSNVANLLLARATSRQKEIAVRLAVGARRARLMRQFLTESVLLAFLGGALGLLISWWGVDLFAAAQGTSFPRLSELRLDATVLLFTLAMCLVTGLLFGLAPALQATSGRLHETLKEAGRHTGSGAGRHHLRGALVVLEVALSLVLLIGAGLLTRSFVSLMNTPRGFDSDDLVVARLSLKPARYPAPARQAEFFHQVVDRLSALPGVGAAALTNWLPLAGGTNGDFLIEGRTFPEDEAPLANLHVVSGDYFRAMRIPLLEGRTFNVQDTDGALKVAIVSQRFARQFLPGEDPVGKRIDPQWGDSGWRVIVGVVGDVKHDSLESDGFPDIYLHYLQRPDTRAFFVLRTGSTPAAMAATVRAQVAAVDRDQPVTWVRAMDDVVASSVSARRLSLWIIGAFAGVALFLAAVGIYGVLSYSVAQRTHEIGVRMALGACRKDVLGMVVRHGMALVGAGTLAGLAGAAAVTRLMSGLLFGVSATDPITFAGIPLVIGVVALLASWVPASRATRVDPMVALRDE